MLPFGNYPASAVPANPVARKACLLLRRLVLPAGGLDHCHDAGPQWFRQMGPLLNQERQAGIGGGKKRQAIRQNVLAVVGNA